MVDRDKWNKLLELARQGTPVRTDSRLVQPGDIFVALRGTRLSAAQFVPEVLDKGAEYAVVSQQDVNSHPPRVVACDDACAALGDLAGAYFRTTDLNMEIVGVTGTNGKTSCTYILEHLLSRAGYKTGIIGTVENRWAGKSRISKTTTPECLELHALLREMEDDGVDVVCMEVSSHALEQKRVAGIGFDYALFTNLTPEHLDYHTDMESYFQAKKRLFFSGKGGSPQAIINSDDEYGRRLINELDSYLSYGLHKEFSPHLYARLADNSPRGLDMQCSYKSRKWRIQSPLVGRHNAANLLAAMGMGLCMGLEETGFSSLHSFSGIRGRLQPVPNNRGKSVFVDYAHTPDALENCCQALRNTGFPALILVFGCGGNRDTRKRPAMGEIACNYADAVVVTSDNPRDEDPEAIIDDVLAGTGNCARVVVEPDRERALRLGVDMCPEEGALLVAGKGHETHQEVCGERREFDDFKVLSGVLA